MATARLDLSAAVRRALSGLSAAAAVVGEVLEERARQNARWGEQNHPDGTGAALPASFRGAADNARELCRLSARMGNLTWRHILLEEVGEALEAPSEDELRTELVQIAAVAVQWAQSIDRRRAARLRALVDEQSHADMLGRAHLPGPQL